jgi:hypothetical protein
MTGKPQVAAWFVDVPIADDDPLREVKERARQLCDPHYQAGQRAGWLDEAAGLFMADGFDPEQTWDAGLAAGLTDADLDAAAYVGMTLWQVEHGTLGE